MAKKRAQTLTDRQFAYLVSWVSQRPQPTRSRVMLMLSYKAGLRAQEIAGLDWGDVLDAVGNVGKSRTTFVDDMPIESRYIFVPGDIAKYGRERYIPLHGDLKAALEAQKALVPRAKKSHPVVLSADLQRMTPDAVRKWFERVYEGAGLEGCSSHSGRRTLITKLAQAANTRHCSLKDVQAIAGHAHIMTTEKYIELSPFIGNLIEAA